MGRTKEYLFYQRALKEISCQSSVEDSALSPLGDQIPSLVSELRSLMPHAVAKKKKKKKHSPSGTDLPLQFKNTPPSPLPAREEAHQELGGLVVLGILVEFAKLLRLQL